MAVVVWSLAVIEITRSCLLLAPATVAYSVVADVEGYPEFLPACESVGAPVSPFFFSWILSASP